MPERRAGDDTERRLLAQLAIATALAKADSAEEAMARVLAALGEQLGWCVAIYWCVDDRQNHLEPAALWHSGDQFQPFVDEVPHTRFVIGQGLPGTVWRDRLPAWVRDFAEREDMPRSTFAARAGLHAAFAFPILAGARCLGVIEAFSDTVEEPYEGVLEASRNVGAEIGHFLERRREIERVQREERRRAAMAETSLDAIIGIDVHGCVNEWNRAAEQVFGWTHAEAIGRRMADLIIPPELRAAHQAGIERFLRTGTPHIIGRRVEVPAVRADGRRIEVELAITQLPVGGETSFIAFLRDVTRERRLARGQELLLGASAMLASSLDYEETLRNLSRVVVPVFADWYAVDVLDDQNQLRRLEVAHRDPAKVQLARELAERYPEDPASAQGVYNVIRTGESELVRDIPDALLTAASQSPEHLELIRSLGLVSYIVVPLRVRDRVIGAISLVNAESHRHYDEADLTIAEELARRAAQAIENARLFREVEETREMLEQQATELEQQAAELEQTALELELSNEELRDTNEELAKRTHQAESAQREADAANKAKSEFLAAMSHELRTPLNAIVGYAELMEVGVHGDISDDQRQDIKRIQRSADHLLGLITDILNFAKIESGKLRYEITPTPLLEVLQAVEDLIRPQAQAKQITYVLASDLPPVYVHADHEKLLQVFVNLLSNAVRFTASGGRIDISYDVQGDRVLTQVRDTGIGIPRDKLEEVFEPFVQVGRQYAGEREGTGLGLAISRELARGMGGDLWANSVVGKGSTFTLSLRRAEMGVRPRADAADQARRTARSSESSVMAAHKPEPPARGDD